MKSLSNLKNEWRICYELALEAITAGSLGISAIITNSSGEIISKGRNQLYDTKDSCNNIKNTLVSHAELNAIAGIPYEYYKDKSINLYTTVEPCPMCIGAVAMSSIRHIYIASKDAWAGSTRLLANDLYLNKKKIIVEYETGLAEQLFFLLNIISQKYIIKNTDHPFLRTLQSQYPKYYQQAESLYNNEEFMEALLNSDCVKVLEMIELN
jgi:tRNA(adenine34) deaminase